MRRHRIPTVAQQQKDMDDADIAAGMRGSLLESAPSSMSATSGGSRGDLEFFEDLVSEPVLVLGMDISHMPRQSQFVVCAAGVFSFSLLYGFLQELISVNICNRKLGLFQAMMQFVGYTVFAFFLRNFVYRKNKRLTKARSSRSSLDLTLAATSAVSIENNDGASHPPPALFLKVPFLLYLGLSLLRAVDLAMTNLAMQYLNYPAKTLMKSSRVVFTMLFGVLLQQKKYQVTDYAIVVTMVSGLVLFMHADMQSSAVFHSTGVVMLTVSLFCDGAISNVSETIMNRYGVGQDEVSVHVCGYVALNNPSMYIQSLLTPPIMIRATYHTFSSSSACTRLP
jgi:solute carrier family 35 (adenosine 3'-phospho 5'-phosphosulfate transporter), member B3